MMTLLLMAGIGALLGGLVAVVFGIPVKEFSFGNTLIVVGAMAACTGLILIGLSVVVAELKSIARRLASSNPTESRSRSLFQDMTSNEDLLEEQSLKPAAAPPSFAIPRARPEAPAAPEPAASPPPASRKQRNLMFAAGSRKERERQGRPDKSPSDLVGPPTVDGNGLPPRGFDDSWNDSERTQEIDLPSLRRGGRPMFAEQNLGAATPLGRSTDQPTATVLKSGVVDGMAYSLYSDGSIEAQLPEGTMRFGSIDELRLHLDQRSG